MPRRYTPFPAIVGQAELKRALLAVAANDALDGLLVRGEKGTAKSTAVRALVELLPEQRAVADCPYGCHPEDPERQCSACRERSDYEVETRPVPLVTLPLGATRERVTGTLSVADALDGAAEFDPGLLARANRGILYVDEVNLLEDHLVDVLLDAAASGVNRVERDGVSVEHPADFTLVGTMNPEEGDLRPQLRDRFALQATVTGVESVEDRVEVIDRALDRHDDPERFADGYESETEAVRKRLRRARNLLPEVDLPAAFKTEIAELCGEAGVDGHRADIATARTAMTLAALDGRAKVIESDVREAATLALPHRLQGRPFENSPDVDDVLDDHFDDAEDDSSEDADGDDGDDGESAGEEASEKEEEDAGDGANADGTDGEDGRSGTDDSDQQNPDGGSDDANESDDTNESDDANESDDDSGGAQRPAGASQDRDDGGDSSSDGDGPPEEDAGEETTATPLVPGQRAEVGDAVAPPVDEVESASATETDGSRANVDPSTQARGSRVRTEQADSADTVDAAASVRAAATEGRTEVAARDLRTSVRTGTAGTLVIFVVDASASMRPAMRRAKGTVLSLLEDAYEQRDEVAFVAVAGDDAEVLLPPTDSVTLAARHLKELPTGDRTPLPAGLDAATRLAARAEAEASLVVVVTDGRANVAEGSPTAATRAAARRLAETESSVVLVDAGDEGAGLTSVIEDATDARRVSLQDLTAERVAHAAANAAAER
ncbi:VWA domain-containing protein [Halobellus ordinarius]|uniref:VWA domain-containing protein n=1 Tax=Halobellus ordinarius TaxID=3075120 RepID=UPI0028803B60|nr:VWA domain-containing protein [Halobellus sp. ZY16]